MPAAHLPLDRGRVALDVARSEMRHATESEYRAWITASIPTVSGQRSRMTDYRQFLACWPQLSGWLAEPLAVRLGFVGVPVRASGRTIAHRASGYLVYLSLRRGVELDYDFLLGRKFARFFSEAGGGHGFGVDLVLFESWIDRLVVLGYPPKEARSHLTWATSRLLLHRGDPDLTAITAADLFELSAALRAFGAREDIVELRAALYTNQQRVQVPDLGLRLVRAVLGKLHATHVLLFNIGQVSERPRVGTQHCIDWTERLLPEPCPAAIRAVIERYLRQRLDAKINARQTVRHIRQALRRFASWLTAEHPELQSLAQVDRSLIEDYLRWLPACISQRSGIPITISTVKQEISALGMFFRDTAIWGWVDVPGRPLITGRDAPRRPEAVPRYLPQHELVALMSAVNDLDNPVQRAALLLLRWSGARRDEIRRLTCDSLDTYPGGHPRLRIPVGKGYTERLIPLHPDAAAALRQAITLVQAQHAIARPDSHTGRPVDYVFLRRGKLLSAAWLFDEAFRTACTSAGLVGADGVPTVSAHRMRHTLGTQLAEGGARIQTIMAILGHKSAAMSMIYTRISDPEIRRQYEAALTSGNRIAGPAADALLHDKLDEQSLHWLQTNFLKTELELGHCLRLPAEGPCECDLVLSCPKFLTTSDYAPRLRARLGVEQQLIDDATQRGWQREIERHTATSKRIEQLLDDLDTESAAD